MITGDMNHDIWINAKSTMSTSIQAEINQQKEDLPLTEQIPKEYHEYMDVFDEIKADHFPESWSWDHKIELKEGFNQNYLKHTTSPWKNKKNWTTGPRTTLTKGIFDHLNLQLHPHSFTLRRKMGNYNPAKTIDI